MKKTERKVFACGENYYGQLGLGHNRNITVPKNRYTRGDGGYTLTDVQSGDSSTFLTYEKGREKVFACGENYYGQLGLVMIVV